MSIRISLKSKIPKRKKKSTSSWCLVFMQIGKVYRWSIDPYDTDRLYVNIYESLISKETLKKNHFSVPIMERFPLAAGEVWKTYYVMMKEENPKLKIRI